MNSINRFLKTTWQTFYVIKRIKPKQNFRISFIHIEVTFGTFHVGFSYEKKIYRQLDFGIFFGNIFLGYSNKGQSGTLFVLYAYFLLPDGQMFHMWYCACQMCKSEQNYV